MPLDPLERELSELLASPTPGAPLDDDDAAAAGPQVAVTVAEQVVALLGAYGVERIFMNPGTDTAPLQEALVSLEARGVAVPSVVLCPYESVALAAAHGYWKMTRRPQCVMVHVDVGTQNLGAMLHDAFRDRAGVVVIAGKAPYSIDERVPGARDRPIHWQQDVPDQIGIVRGYTKWAVELARADMAERTIGRALQIAEASPPGPTYITVARDVLMEPPAPRPENRGRRYRPPAKTGLEESTARDVARRIAGAERPLIVTSAVGRDPRAAEALRALVELAGIPVAGTSEAISLPWTHPQWVRGEERTAALVAAADLLLVVECDVPWLPGRVLPAEGACIVQLDPDPVRADMPLWSYPADISLQADSAVALGQLREQLQVAAGIDGTLPARWAARSHWHETSSHPGDRSGSVRGDPDAIPGAIDVVSTLNQFLRDDDIVIDESVTNAGAVHEHLVRTLPGTFLSAGGPGLGWALGGAIGVKLARPHARVVAIVGDGSFLFAVPTAALLVAAQAHVPFVAIVLNNRGYVAAERPVFNLFPDGVSVRRGRAIATYFEATVDFAGLAGACGAFGATVRTCGELAGALEQAFGAEADGRAGVLDVILGDR